MIPDEGSARTGNTSVTVENKQLMILSYLSVHIMSLFKLYYFFGFPFATA